MSTESNWIYSNLLERERNLNLDFKILFNPRPFKKLSFEEAIIDSLFKIANKSDNLFVSLSGGLDSEFIAKQLFELKIPFIPIIICVDDANKIEREYAFHICRKLNIQPVILKISETDFIKEYVKNIFNRFGGNGYNATPIIFAGN